MARKFKPWPTPEMPEAPVSFETHGEYVTWSEEDKTRFREWALSLKDYAGPGPESVIELPKGQLELF